MKMSVKRPDLSVVVVLETFPRYDVALTLALPTGSESGPVTCPRMTSDVWALRTRNQHTTNRLAARAATRDAPAMRDIYGSRLRSK